MLTLYDHRSRVNGKHWEGEEKESYLDLDLCIGLSLLTESKISEIFNDYSNGFYLFPDDINKTFMHHNMKTIRSFI